MRALEGAVKLHLDSICVMAFYWSYSLVEVVVFGSVSRARACVEQTLVVQAHVVLADREEVYLLGCMRIDRNRGNVLLRHSLQTAHHPLGACQAAKTTVHHL